MQLLSALALLVISLSGVAPLLTTTFPRIPLPSSIHPVPLPVPACNPSPGWQWASYSGPFTGLEDASTLQTRRPQENGTSPSIGWIALPGWTDDTLNASNSFAMQHRAYLLVPQSGRYSFAFSGVIDRVRVWLGSEAAYAGYTNGNQDDSFFYQRNQAGDFEQGAGVVDKYFAAGQYVPLRVLFYNAGHSGGFIMKITGPDGQELSDDYAMLSGCDENGKPVSFRRWGNEA